MADEHDLRMRRFRDEAAKALDELRPDRYVVSDTTEDDDIDGAETHEDTEWLDKAAGRVATLLPDETVKKLYAREIMGRMESTALRRGNKKIREYHAEAQPDLGWLDAANYPIQVVHRIAKKGERVRVRRERVKIAAMTSADLRQFAIEERKNAADEFETRNKTCKAAEWMANEMDKKGAKTVAAWIKAATQEAAA